MNETTKAMTRRWHEDAEGIFPWKEVFVGNGIDIGCGPDKLPFDDCIGFDVKDGDANNLAQYFKPQQFDYVHGSHVLEHMLNPESALANWLTLVKRGGYVVQTVPDVGAFERFTFPSKFNADHRSSWSMIYKGSPFPIHCHIPTFLAQFSDVAKIKLMRYVEENYDWEIPPEHDQTWIAENGVEIWCEFVLQKL